MDGVKKEEHPDASVEVIAAAAEFFKRLAFGEEFVDGEALAQAIQRQIALVPAAGDNAGKAAHED
jgi:hypothetical protein